MRAFFRELFSRFKSLSIHLIIPVLIALIVVVYFANRTFIFVHPGEAAVLWSRFFGGTRTNYVYPEGFHAILPWDVMHIYNVRIQQIAEELDVLTNTGLEIHLYLSIRYQPDYQLLGVLHQQVGPDYPQTVILPEIKSVLREIIGTMGAEEVYTTGRRVIIEAINQAIEQISQRYIMVDKVLIERIELPTSVAEAIRFKIEQRHRIEAQEAIAEQRRIEGQGIRDQFQIVNEALHDEKILKWRGIEATLKLAESENAKVVIIGSGQEPFQLFGQVPLEPDAWNMPPGGITVPAAETPPEETAASEEATIDTTEPTEPETPPRAADEPPAPAAPPEIFGGQEE